MNILHNKYDTIENIIFKQGLRITSLELNPEHDKLLIYLNTNMTLVAPTKNYKGLKNASVKRLKNYRLISDGVGIHWPDLDEDLSLKGFLKEFLNQKLKSHRKMVLA
ncbi:DUF2442 domain-containing protein [Ferruginibacter sp. HRS2-29]|uniref:DUF2442 domain-containing protein n=1 Tax=Ferruginibacter sp. HRS2-29 TaxID=2487334 RepID=UPI0020CCA83A|nr:DUF2442 domain-containing protein [Ferruginibacter sp. HRS2-29]MCP9750889.1 DUF2442 domain-containing protein [Ferruginibacter sp. HRS2-29]